MKLNRYTMEIFWQTHLNGEDRFVIQWHQLLWFTHQFKAISECRQQKISQRVKQTRPQKLPRNGECKLSLDVGEGRFLREVMYLSRKKKGKSKVLSDRYCIHHSEEEQRALHLLHIFCSNVNSYSSAPESKKQTMPD